MISLVSDDLWAAIVPLLPRERPKPKGGRPRCDDRLALAAIIFVLRSGIPWKMLPREFGCSVMTCWRRLRDWQTAGVWPGFIACCTSGLEPSVPRQRRAGKKRGAETGPNPTDRGRAFGWEQAANSEKGIDAVGADGKTRYQIKGRRVHEHNKSRQLSAIRELDSGPFDCASLATLALVSSVAIPV